MTSEQINEVRRVLLRAARRLGLSPQDADDAVQETLLRMLTRWNRFDGRNLVGWGVMILRRWVNDQRGSAAARLNSSLYDAVTGAPLQVPVPANQDTVLMVREVLEAIAALPADRRDLLIDVLLGGKPLAQVAAEHRLPIGTVQSRVHRATQEIRAQLTSPPRRRLTIAA